MSNLQNIINNKARDSDFTANIRFKGLQTRHGWRINDTKKAKALGRDTKLRKKHEKMDF